MDKYENLIEVVKILYYSAYWSPDRDCGIEPGLSHILLGPPRK